MTVRRLVGIDLGIASAHTVRVLDETGNTIAKRKAVPTVESLAEIETAALGDAPQGTRLALRVARARLVASVETSEPLDDRRRPG